MPSPEVKTAAFAAGTGNFLALLGVESIAAQGAVTEADFRLFKAYLLGRMPRLYENSLTPALTLLMSRGGVITFTGATSVACSLPNFATLGYTRDPVNPVEAMFMVQRGGTGVVNINPVGGVVINWNGMNINQMLQNEPPRLLVTNGADSWECW